jgi:protein-S-isoprenylcysteine O-methyltransferase Ste14
MVVFAKVQPGLVEERRRWREGKAWDRPLVFLVGLVGPAVVQLVCGLDKRFGWSADVPTAVQVGAGVAFAAGIAVTAWAMAVNAFFSATVRIQTDRGQHPVADGPYRVVRHPAYAAMIVGTAAGPVLLGALAGLIPAAIVIIIFIARTALEDRTLRDELPGYTEYARRVRWRLVPGLW